MPDAANRPTDLIIGASLVSAEAIAQELRRRLVKRLSRRRYSQWELLTIARNLLREYEPILAENLMNADLASWIAGVDQVIKRMPGQSVAAFLRGAGPPTTPITLPTGFGDEPVIRFPLIEKARESLEARNIVTRAEFETMAAQAKERAFTAAYIDSEETIEEIRDALADTIREGASLRVFREKIEEAVGSSPIGPAHLEMVYRTNIQAAFSAGLDDIANHPIVDELFPYAEYLPILDGRVRSEHLQLATLGLSGTGVYRRDDPFWDFWTPPNGFNCFLPSTQIQGKIEAGSRAWYDGKIIEITTRRGNRLTVTVNHPVLTEDGFVAASTLRKGQNVLSYGSRIDLRGNSRRARESSGTLAANASYGRLSAPNLNKQHAPSSAEKLFASLSLIGDMVKVPVVADDLHGDAAFGDGYVDVVSLKGELQRDAAAKFCGNLSLPFADSLAFRDRDFSKRVRAHCSSGSGLPRCSALTFNCGAAGLNLGPFEFLGIGPAANIDIRRLQAIHDNAAVDAVLLANSQNRLASQIVGNDGLDGHDGASLIAIAESLLLADTTNGYAGASENALEAGVADSCFYREFAERFPGSVSSDQIVDVRQCQWSGHVYDFQAQGGWLAADGIIVSNCRCGRNLLTIEAAARKGVKEAQDWLRTGRPPAIPEWRIDFIPFQNEPGFGGRRRAA